MKVLISGGVKNAKSSYAEDLAMKLSKNNRLYYLATMIPYDEEDHKRVKLHQLSREGKGFSTIEVATDIDTVLNKSDYNSTFLLDSLTALVLNEMFKNENKKIEEISNKIKNNLNNLMNNVDNIVIVTDYIFSDYQEFSDFTIDYLKLFADVSKFVAKNCDLVIERVAGCNNILKGEELI